MSSSVELKKLLGFFTCLVLLTLITLWFLGFHLPPSASATASPSTTRLARYLDGSARARLSIGLRGHRGNYLDLPFPDLRGQRGLGLLAAGQEQWWRGESVLQTGLRQSACKTGSGAWCPVWDWSAHVCSPHQVPSSVQLARSVALQLSATPSLQRQRLASTWRLQGYLTPPSSIESNGCRHSLRVRGLSSLRAGGALRCRRGWFYTGSGARGDQKAFSRFVGSSR